MWTTSGDSSLGGSCRWAATRRRLGFSSPFLNRKVPHAHVCSPAQPHRQRVHLLFDACLVKVQELWQPGYIIEPNVDGTLTVFVPQAPIVALGQVYIVEPGRVRKLDIDSAALNARLKVLGKGVLGAAAR